MYIYIYIYRERESYSCITIWLYNCIDMCMYLCIYIYICIYIERERDTHTHMYMCIYICIYIYICMYREIVIVIINIIFKMVQAGLCKFNIADLYFSVEIRFRMILFIPCYLRFSICARRPCAGSLQAGLCDYWGCKRNDSPDMERRERLQNIADVHRRSC